MSVVESILSLIAPHECLVCADEGGLLCEPCRLEHIESVPERCYRCLAKTRNSLVCQKCRKSSVLTYVWVSTEYDGLPKTLIKRFKFERAIAACDPIAELISDTLPYLKPETVITFIPTATSRHRMRGYDQSELLAKRIAKIKGATFVPLLERSSQTRQVGSTKKQRIIQASNMFRLRHERAAEISEVIIIDDILTTGASLEAAAGLLKKAGIKQVSAAVFAQKH